MINISQETIKLQHEKILKSLSLYLLQIHNSEKQNNVRIWSFFRIKSEWTKKYVSKKTSNLYTIYAAISRNLE